MPPSGKVQRICSSQQANLWINGGFFIFRPAIFDYMRLGEELVEAPFQRLIEADQLMAFRHEGFWRPMDTLKDKQVLEDLVEKGVMPWHLNGAPTALGQRRAEEDRSEGPGARKTRRTPLRTMHRRSFGRYRDRRWRHHPGLDRSRRALDVHWAVFSASARAPTRRARPPARS